MQEGQQRTQRNLATGVSPRWTQRARKEIARKGGASVPSEKRSFSQDRTLAAQAGRKGGEASHGGRGKTGRNGQTQTPNS